MNEDREELSRSDLAGRAQACLGDVGEFSEAQQEALSLDIS
jgi:hypothetical protein